MGKEPAQQYGTIAKLDGLQMPSVRFQWRPLTYLNFLGAPQVVQANRHFENVPDALRLLRYTLEHQRQRMRKLAVDPKVAKRFGFLYFRGQSRVEWPLMPTIYRDLPENKHERDTTIADRLAMSVDFFQRAQHHSPEFEKRSIEQKRAIGRHYGMPNEYTDWTTDPEIAAFFAAQNAFSDSNGYAVGNIYMLNLEYLFEVFRWKVQEDADGTLLLLYAKGNVLEIPYLSIDDKNCVIQTSLRIGIRMPDKPFFAFRWLNPTGVHRIEVQKGSFIRVGGGSEGLFDEHTINWLGGTQAWQLLDFLTFKFTFVQKRPYRNLWRGIYNRHLLPPNEPFQNIANNVLLKS